jgi:hypothetical protein
MKDPVGQVGREGGKGYKGRRLKTETKNAGGFHRDEGDKVGLGRMRGAKALAF